GRHRAAALVDVAADRLEPGALRRRREVGGSRTGSTHECGLIIILPPMRVVREIVRDTLTIARTLHGNELGPRQIAATLAHDGAQTLALWRLRTAAARQHIPLVGGVLRRMQTMLFGIHIESDV